MYIKSIVLDGFKSYGHRVEITGFDKEFNAITGLNGTGKSNILDSICFVLGITNLSNVRASSLQELIYKHGQAGITKATVSITFDNRDKSPIGYENHNEITVTRQVVMGGKNKYLINGINVQNKRVSDLFCSVQLNVNNPHFLIMQGRITKVLNMKPPEILSMVEEAAGTRMYEAKKQAAQKTIEKKDAKLKELNDIITEDIAPKIQHLQDEKAQFQEYQKVVRELDNLSKLHVAYKYVTGQEMSVEAQSKVTEVQDDIKSTKEVIKNNEKEVKQLDAKIVDLTKKLEEESGAAVSQLTSAAAALSRAEAEAQAAQAAQRGARDALRSHRTRARLLERARADDDAALRDKQAALAEVSAAFEGMRLASETSEAALSAAQDKFVAVSTGEDDGSGSLQDRLMAAMTTASEASMHSEQVAMELTQATKRLRTLEREFSSISGQYQRDQDTIANYQVQLDQLKPQLAALQPSVARCASARAEARRLGLAARAHRDALELHEAPLQRCQFDYHPPDHNFDHGRVYGTICKLLEVRDPVYSTALETAAGGRLYNVVVDTEVTSKLLLDRGRLQSRRIIIPLNKISGPVMDPQTLRIAQEIGGGSANVQLALELVTFPAAVQAAMAWVFGNTLVCRDLDTAKRVTFHPRVRRRCVTLDGDVFDPSGTLTGGARIQGGSVLVQLAEQRAREQQLAAVEAQLAECSQQLLVDLQRKADTYNDMQQRYELLAHELGVVTARNETTAYAETHDEIENLRVKVAELTAALEQAKIKEKETAAVALELEEKVKDIKGHRERQLKKAKEELKQAKALAARHGGDWRQHQQELEALRLEVAALAADGAAARAQLADAARLDDELLQQLDRARADHESATSKVKDIQAQIKRQKAEMSSKNSDIAKLIQKKDNLTKINCDLQLKIKELEYKVTELKAEAVECQNRISALESEHPWIASERAYFGSAGGLYDFEARGAHVAGARVLQLRARRERLARGLNARAHTLLSQKEDQYQDVMRKKRIVEADRAKLVEVMSELDEMKKKTLVTAYEQVNKDFASIFATLLPGAQARLRPPDGLTELDGLEVNVGFNNIWKESLGELSGGQRSLVALSLVLAMLLFKPAPLYILDEVDAALDLSHTQNIGQMLKNHFKHSQFIIVSLKDGMFNNANVLFRTKFVDGMSSVQRTVNATR